MRDIVQKNSISKLWSWVRLADVLKTSSGGTPDTSIKEFWQNGTVPWLNSGALKDGLITAPTTYISEDALSNSSARLFPPNTLLVALTGATLGRIGLLDIECSTNQSVTGIFPSEYLLPKFLYYYFLFIRNQLISQAKGSAQPHINKGIIDDTMFPLAPITHQTALVNLLDELMSYAQDIKHKADHLKVLEENAFKSYIYNNDDLYPTIKIGEFCSERSERIGSEWHGKRLIGVSKEDGVLDLRVSGKSSYEKYKKVHKGDFLYNPMRVNIGSITIYDEDEVVLTSPDYVVFTINHTLSPLLLLNYLKSDIGLSQINNNTQGSVRSRLYYSSLAKMELPFCGIEGQQEAQTVLESFKKMKLEASALLQGLSKTFEYAFKKSFSGKQFEDIPFSDSATVLEQLMKDELKNLNQKRRRPVKRTQPIKKMPKKSVVDILSIIKNEFGYDPFTFDKLYNVSGMSYETLKDQIYEMLGEKVVLAFNEDEEKMHIKLIGK